MKNNDVTLYEGLYLFRNAVHTFIMEKLQSAFGKGLWKAAVEPALGESGLTVLESQFRRRHKETLPSAARFATDACEALDIPHFLPIIRKNWSRCFVDTFKDQNRNKVEVWLGEIIDVRNAVAHPEHEPLSDKDTWRALDTMARLLEVIDPGIASRISQLRDGESNFPETSSQRSPPEFGLIDGLVDYRPGLSELQRAVLSKEQEGSEVHLKLLRHHDQLERLICEKKLTPGIMNPEVEVRIEKVLQELDALALNYSSCSFRQLCSISTKPPPSAPKDALARIRELDGDISDLEHKLYTRERKRAAQRESGETVTLLERQIEESQTLLDAKRKEREHLLVTSSPQVYFSIQRHLVPNDDRIYVEEQYINVSVEVTNEGKQGSDVVYEEQLPDGFELVGGDLLLQAHIGAGDKATLSYRCCPTCAGKYHLSTRRLDYKGGSSEWDRIHDTSLEIRTGGEPRLALARYYHLEQQGLKLIINLKNSGDKIARNCRYAEQIGIAGRGDAVQLAWQGDIPGNGAERTIVHLLPVAEPEGVSLADTIDIEYEFRHDGKYEHRTIAVKPGVKRIEYSFPVATDVNVATVGRGAELRTLESLILRIRQMAFGADASDVKRLLLVSGIEGTGKTRLVHELVKFAQGNEVRWYVESAKDRSPIKRMLRRLLDLRPDNEEDEVFWKQLVKVLPGEERSRHRSMIMRFVSDVQASYSDEELDQLQAYVVALVKVRCHRTPTLLIFEDIHLTLSGGLEQRLLTQLLNCVLISSHEPILLCATYRPSEKGDPEVVSQLPLSPSNHERLELGTIDGGSIRALVDMIVDFPHFSLPLHEFVKAWSGNPLYIIELLRLLTHPDARYLTHTGNEWYPAPGVKLQEATPNKIQDVILERIQRELTDDARRLAQTLSVVGSELPAKLIETLGAREFGWPDSQLYHRLDTLVKTGFLTWTSREGYQFEHQLKREVLEQSLPERERLRLHQYIAKLLREDDIPFYPNDRQQQLVRHLVKCERTFQMLHVSEIQKVAELERDARNFDRSLELYDLLLDLASQESLTRAQLLIERSRVYQFRGNWVTAERDLKAAYQLAVAESGLPESRGKLAKSLRMQANKEQGRIMLRQPQASLETANDLLFQARKGIEGNLPYVIARHLLPNRQNTYQDLIDIYVALAELQLRLHHLRVCEVACKRAEWLAKKASKKWAGRLFLPEVYEALGDLYLERGKKENFEAALRWYEAALSTAKSDPYQQGRILCRLADTYDVRGDMDRAREAYERAIQIQKQLGDAHGLALSCGGLGNLLVDAGKLAEGRPYCEQAHEYQQLMSDVARFWRTCLSLAKVHVEEGNSDRAVEYYLQARAALFDQKRVDNLTGRKRQEILELNRNLCDHLRRSQELERLYLCIADRDYLVSYSMNRNERVQAQADWGVVAFESGRWEEAIEHFKYVLEMSEHPDQRIDACEWLGDVCAKHEPPASSASRPTQAGEVQEEAEYYYEEAIKYSVRFGDSSRAQAIYEKLLNRMVADEAGLMQLPFTFFTIFGETSSIEFLDQIVNKICDVLLKNRLFSEAGDILVYASRIVTRVGECDPQVPLDRKLGYLRRAEEVYRRGGQDDIIWGLNMLIPTYSRLAIWDKVKRCFEELLELNFEAGNSSEFIETLKCIMPFAYIATLEDLRSLVTSAILAQRQLDLTDEQRAYMHLYTAKAYGFVADKSKGADIARYMGLSLEYFDRILNNVMGESEIVTTALNDSAVELSRDDKQYEQAIQRWSRAIEIDEKLSRYVSAAHSRVNRAVLLQAMGERGKARSDIEQAIKFLERQVEHWDERLTVQDQQALSPHEIATMVHDKKWLASTSVELAILLSRNPQQAERSQELTRRAAKLYKELGMDTNGKNSYMAISIAQFLSQKKRGPGLRQCPSCRALIAEGAAECPFCEQCICPNCGASVDENDDICSSCGTAQPLYCTNCGEEVSQDDLSCPNCGESFEESEGED